MNLIKKFFHNNEEIKEEKFEISNDEFEKRKEKFIDRTSKNDNFLCLKMDKYDLGEFLFPTIFAAINSEGKERIFDIKEDKYMPFEFAKLKLSSLESKDKFKVVIEEIKFIGNDYGFNFELTLPFKDNMPEYKKVSASYEIPKIEKLKYEEYRNYKKVSLEYFLLTSKAEELSYLFNKNEIKYVKVFQNGKELEFLDEKNRMKEKISGNAYQMTMTLNEFKKSLWQDTIKLLSLTKKQIEKIEAVIVKCLDKSDKKNSVNIITFLMDEKNKCTLKFKKGKLLTSYYNIYSPNDSPLIRKQEIDVEKECRVLLKKDSPKMEFSAIEINALTEGEGFVQFQLGMDMEHNCCEWFDVVLEKEFEKVYVESIELEIEENMEKYVDLKGIRSRREETGIICRIYGKNQELLTKGYAYNIHNGYYSHKVVLQENGEYDIIEI
jgi:hypothetical protein